MSEFEYVAYFLIGAIATARLTRLVVFDVYPPAVWLRIKWDDHTSGSAWNDLLHCGYCLAPYIAAIDLAVGTFLLPEGGVLAGLWIIPNIWLAMSYLASILVAYDGDDSE